MQQEEKGIPDANSRRKKASPISIVLSSQPYYQSLYMGVLLKASLMTLERLCTDFVDSLDGN
jgi:hypothetical protein